ncbi:MAG: SoxXA-binding protein [Chromatiaceae bacterium]|nr:SoxXA-binding protein [Gammaproteobacteria bacterium]MCP5298184.1 SoxXA-binding protein [Chromatiaceae bacterium]MCP5423276.1 SoxXA-binding protein [Chromatiaceae bacterium]
MKITTLFLLGVCCLATLPVASATQDDFQQKLGAAEKARERAASVGGVWRDVDKLLKDARAAAAGGDFDKATALASTALTQSELGYQQAQEQKDGYRVPAALQ